MRPPLLLLVLTLAACGAPRQGSPSVRTAPRAEPSRAVAPAGPRVGPGAEPEEEGPEALRSEEVLGCPVEDAAGRAVGVVQELLLDPGTGDVGRIAVHTAGDAQLVLPAETATWAAGEDGLVLVLDDPGSASGEERADVREPETLAGVVDSKQLLDQPDGTRELRLILRAPDNHYHRITLGLLEQLGPLPFSLEPGQELEVDGRFTRDADGKLFRVASMRSDGEEVELPEGNGDGEPEPELRSLAGVSVVTADGALVEVAGFDLSLEPVSVQRVRLRVDGAQRAIEWRRLSFDPDSGWRTDFTRELLLALDPAAPPAGPPDS
jgi:hypothetical protein